MKQILTFLSALLISVISMAQTAGNISGSINYSETLQPDNVATISLLNSKDSSLVKFQLPDKDNHYSFKNNKDGSYLISASQIGYATAFSKIFIISVEKNNVELPVLTLTVQSKQLNEVTVTTKKLLIERKLDKTIINVDAAVTNAGSSAMDILEKSPGVTVDKDGNISLKGKQGVMIMLDGKPSYLNAQELANLLRSMSAANLDQIEIMTNPSAKYDAAGNSGIINIKTKKSKQKGFNGSVNLGYGQGVYAKTNNSLNLNFRQGKFNFFSTVSINHRNNFQHLDINRIYKNPDQTVKAIFSQNGKMLHKNGNNSAKIGVDFYAGKKTTVGIVFNGFSNTEKQRNLNTSYLKNKNNVLDSIAVSTGAEDGTWKNGGVNLNFRHEVDSTGRDFTMDADYVNYKATKYQPFDNAIYLPGGNMTSSGHLFGDLPSKINIYSIKADYTHPLKNGIKIETGLKSSFVKTDNTAGYFNVINDVKVPDYEKTNRFKYQENINAAYLNANKEIKKLSFQAGLRLENTNYSGNQFGNPQKPDSLFKRSYFALFPTMFVGYKANEKNQLSFSYGRRINRPAYEDLNPFMFYLDKYTYGMGNPFLRPSYANVIEFSHIYNQWLTTTINYSHTKDLFNEMFEQRGFATVIKEGNFASADNASLSVNTQNTIGKIWTVIVYAEANYNQYKGMEFGNNSKTSGTNYLINITNQFKFNNGWSAELSGFYRTKGIEGQISINPLSQVNAGVQKEILKKNATIKLNIRDAFFSMIQNGKINLLNTDASFHQYGDSRVLSVSFSYRFGKQFKTVAKRKTGGAGEEQNRVKGAN